MPDVITVLENNVVTTEVAGADILLPMAVAASAENSAAAQTAREGAEAARGASEAAQGLSEAARDTAVIAAATAGTAMSQAQLAALAAGAPLYTVMPTAPFTGVPSPFLYSSAMGVFVYTHNGAAATLGGALGTGAGYVQDGKVVGSIVGVLRQDTLGSGWYPITTGGHATHGLASVALAGTNLRVTYDFTGSDVGTFMVNPDETFAAWNVTFGVSVGANIADISGYAPISGSILAGTNGIQWIAQVGNFTSQTVDQAAGTIVVVHGSQSHDSSRGSAVMITEAEGSSIGRFVLKTSTKTGFTLQYVSDLACRIACTDTTPGAEVFTVSESLNTGISAAWIGASNCVRVTFPAVGNSKPNCRVDISKDGSVVYVSRTDNQGSTTCDIFFYDMAGTLITVATSSMIFHFSKPGKFPIAIPNGTTLLGTVQRDMVPIDMNKLHSGGGNAWIFALMNR